MEKKKLYLTLQNGTVFQGYAFGASGAVTGELVFSTSMVGYMENLTDPANFGQILVQTFPLIGNYGSITKDVESDKAWVSAYVVRELCDTPSNFRMEGTLEEYLIKEGVVGIYGVDTRELTKILRENGVMNARISETPLTDAEILELSSYQVENAVKTIAPTSSETFGSENAKYTVALWNFGCKKSTIENLIAKDCRVISMPAYASAEEILSVKADAVVLSDGAGDPKAEPEIVAEIKKLLGKTPVFGIGLGHQFVALALGADTRKQKYGHRGGNQPVKSKAEGRVYISAQNHGYEVVSESVVAGEITHVNVNDGSCEGIDYPDYKAFTVQFTPESCDIGVTENQLYKKFFAMIEKERENA